VFIACAGCHRNRNGVSSETATQYAFIIATFGVVFYLIHMFDYLAYYFGWVYYYHGWIYWLLFFARASTLCYYWIFNGRYIYSVMRMPVLLEQAESHYELRDDALTRSQNPD